MPKKPIDVSQMLNKTIHLPHDFKSLDELLDSADDALFRVIVRNPHHVLHPLLPPRKRTVYNLRKLTHGLTITQVCSSLMRKNFIRMLYTDVYYHLSVYYIAAYWCLLTDILYVRVH